MILELCEILIEPIQKLYFITKLQEYSFTSKLQEIILGEEALTFGKKKSIKKYKMKKSKKVTKKSKKKVRR